MMRAAGMSEATIGHFLDCDYMTVNAILKRPRVARFLIALESTFVEDLKASAKHLDDAILSEANRAFHVEKNVMERLYEMRDSIRAQLGAAATAQDILDRAGKRAPTRVQTEVTHTIDAEALSHVAKVLGEHKAIDVTNYQNGADGETRTVEEERGDEVHEESKTGIYP
jgi:hypothetical protein